MSLDTSCGLHGTPWIIEALPGQHIDIKMTDFDWSNGTFIDNECPMNYGYILDLESDDVISLCGGTDRVKYVYQSIGHTVQIILESNNLESKAFLLELQGK